MRSGYIKRGSNWVREINISNLNELSEEMQANDTEGLRGGYLS